MGSKSSSPPPAPDPAATAAAQSAQNRETAITQANLNMVNQRDPFGNSLQYNQIGSWEDGTPRYEAVQNLSPEQQQIFLQQQGITGDALSTAQTLLGNVQNQAGQAPPAFDEAYRKQQLDAIMARQQPNLDRERAKLETSLANQGIGLGSEAYTNAMRDFNTRLNDLSLAADTQAGTEARQAYATALTGRNQPINELTGLLSLGGVQNPQFTNTPQTGVAPTDITGPTALAYQGQLNGYNQGQANNRALLGAATQLGGAALGGWSYGGFR